MTTISLATLSNELADLTAAGAATVVQVAGRRRPASGVIHGPDTIVTTARAIGRDDRLQVRLPDDSVVEADLGGWDPATGIAVLRTRAALPAPPARFADTDARTGEIVLAVARSWSNAVTASVGTVAVVGGPLRTGRRRQIERIIRVTAPMHEGFAGGAVLASDGRVAGIATASQIRGFGVVIPASIALASAAQILTSGTPHRPFIGVAVQSVELPPKQRSSDSQRAVLVVGVTPSSPADISGINVGDILLDIAGKPLESPDDLLDLLSAHQSGQALAVRLSRAGSVLELPVTVGQRP